MTLGAHLRCREQPRQISSVLSFLFSLAMCWFHEPWLREHSLPNQRAQLGGRKNSLAVWALTAGFLAPVEEETDANMRLRDPLQKILGQGAVSLLGVAT